MIRSRQTRDVLGLTHLLGISSPEWLAEFEAKLPEISKEALQETLELLDAPWPTSGDVPPFLPKERPEWLRERTALARERLVKHIESHR